LFPENWIEKHGDAAIQDKWSFTELASFMSARKERDE